MSEQDIQNQETEVVEGAAVPQAKGAVTPDPDAPKKAVAAAITVSAANVTLHCSNITALSP